MSKGLIDQERKYILQTYKRLPIVIDKAEGCRIWDTDGREYLDFLSGIAVNALGHGHPLILEALATQAGKYMHVSNYFYQEPQIKLAEALCEVSGMDRVFFTNSGTESTEGAVKLIRRWGNGRGKREIVAFTGGFHGRSYAALSMMDKPQYKEGMGPFLEDTRVIPYNDREALRATVNDKTSAVVLEFLQGEGGIVAAAPDFVDMIVRLREGYNFMLVADEIQCGVGRTGTFFGYEHYGIKPDIVTLAKGMGGGMPLGALLANEKLADVWQPGMHGTTYGGNAVACATGLAVINELKDGLLDKVRERGAYLMDRLLDIKKKFPGKVAEVRGKGLMAGLLLNGEAAPLVRKLLDKGVISNAASGNVLRLVPPLIITNEDIDEFHNKLKEALAELD
ncbi:MAG: aspartate aminotransferase family protein [Candidatus Kapaibacterium sp.]